MADRNIYSISNVKTSPAIANVTALQTDSVIVAANDGLKIRVVSLICQTGTVATNITFGSKGSDATTAISAVFQNPANGGEVLPNNMYGWFQSLSGEGLVVTTGAGSTTGITLNYVLI